jgi:hypothetical protein
MITREDVDTAGGNILDDFYQRSFQEVRTPARIFVEDRLLTASVFRNTVPEEEAAGAGLSPQDISRLIDRRLIRREQRLGVRHLELTHDLLTEVVRSSRDARRLQAAQAAEQEKRLLAERRKRSRTIRTITGVAAFLIAGLLVAALVQRQNAERLRTDAERAQAVALASRLNTAAIGSPDGSVFVTVSNGRGRLLNTGNGRVIRVLQHPGEPMRAAAFSPDGKWIVTTGPATVRLWDVTSGSVVSELNGMGGWTYTAAFSADSKFVVTCSFDQTARVWDIATGRLIATIKGDSPLRSAAFSPDGAFVLIVSESGALQKWDLRNNRPVS